MYPERFERLDGFGEEPGLLSVLKQSMLPADDLDPEDFKSHDTSKDQANVFHYYSSPETY